MTFYCNYGCISVVSEIPVFNVLKYRDLEIPVQSIKIMESETIR